MKDVQRKEEDAMTLSTADLIAEVLRLDEEATKGPWANKPSEHRLQDGQWRYQDEYGNWTSCIRPDPDSPVENTLAEFWGTEFNDEVNAKLVTHYRTSAPELARRLRDAEEKLARANTLTADDVEWVVNDIAELGVKIGDQFFFLYKGASLVYGTDEASQAAGVSLNEDVDPPTPHKWRPVFKREFGECAHPINYNDPRLIGTVSLDDSDEWRDLPPALASKEPGT